MVNMRLEGKIAVVTGGASGLGAATVKLLVQKGCKVAIWDFNDSLGSALSRELGAASIFSKCDVSCPQSVAAAITTTLQSFPRIDILVNCAGIIGGQMMYSKSKGLHSLELFEKIMKVNVYGTFNVCRLVAERMAKQPAIEGERGVIVNTASVAGIEGQRGQVAYGGSKGAIIGMTLPMARDLGALGIRVSAIAPGLFMTPMAENVDKAAVKAIEKSIVVGRFGRAEEYAHTVQYIVENTYVTGTVIRVDGGVRLPHI